MTAKEYLKQLWWLEDEVNNKYAELEALESLIGVRARSDLDEKTGRSGSISDPVASVAIKIVQLQHRLNWKNDRYVNLLNAIIEQIDGLEDPDYRNILTKRYVLHETYKTWEQIAEAMACSVQKCYVIHGSALQEFTRKYLKKIE